MPLPFCKYVANVYYSIMGDKLVQVAPDNPHKTDSNKATKIR